MFLERGSCVGLAAGCLQQACSNSRDSMQQMPVACAAHACVCQALITGSPGFALLHQYCTAGIHPMPHLSATHVLRKARILRSSGAAGIDCLSLCMLRPQQKALAAPPHLWMATLGPALASARRTRTYSRWRWWMLGVRAAAEAAAGAGASAASAPMWRMRCSAGGPDSESCRWPGTLVGPSSARV